HLLEFCIRRCVLRDPAISLLSGEVTGLLSKDGVNVAGVKLDDRDIEADLVACTVASEKTLFRWLAALSYRQPRTSIIDPGVRYVSRYFERAPGKAHCYTVYPFVPQFPAGGVLSPIEGGRWIGTALIYKGVECGFDDHGFVDYFRQLRNP